MKGVPFVNIIVCIDNNKGMLFNGRRQSQDKVLREKALEMCVNLSLYVNEYTAKQFDAADPIIIDNSFLEKAQPGDFCFVENSEIPVEKVEKFYVFNWNRNYPGDAFFEVDLVANGFKKTSQEAFVGSSHDEITLEIYER